MARWSERESCRPPSARASACDVAHGYLLREQVAGHAVVKRNLSAFRQLGELQQVADVAFTRAVKYRRRERHTVAEAMRQVQDLVVVHAGDRLPHRRGTKRILEPFAHALRARFLVEQLPDFLAELFRSPAQVRFENLADVHTRRNAQRVQHDFHRSAIRHVGHVFLRNDARDYALVTMASGHLVSDGELALHGDVALHQLDHARRQLVALLQLADALVSDFAQHIDLPRGHFLNLVDFLDEQRVLVVEPQALQVACGDLFQDVARQLAALGQQTLIGALVVQVGGQRLSTQQVVQALQAFVGENADFIGQVLFQFGPLRGFDGLVAFVLLRTLAAEDLHVHDGAFDARRAIQRSVAHVSGFFTENRAQQLFFRRQRGFALGRYLAYQNVARLHCRADADYSTLVQIAQEAFVDVRNVPRNFLGTELRVARFDFILFDVNRSVVILFHQLFADQNRVLEVVPAPGHEGHQHVAAKRQFAAIRARTVGQHLTLLHAVARAHQRLLADAGVLVRALELRKQVNVRPDFAAQYAGLIGFHAHDHALGVHLVHNAIALAHDHSARIASRNAFHARAHQRSVATNQRHSLPLHVRAHQRAVGVVVLEERNQAGRNRYQLLRRDVNVINFLAALQHEVARLTAVHQFRGDAFFFIERRVGLRYDVAVFFPGREIEAMRRPNHAPPLQLFVGILDFFLLDNFPGLEFAVARIHDLHEVNHAPVLHLAIRRFDEAELVDPRVRRKRADQTDVRAFRRFNWTNAAVVRRVHVADFESRAFPRQAAWSQSRKTPLVRDFAQGVGLVHELRKLRAAEKFANRRHYRLGVHQIVRHGRGHFLVHGHLFLDRALHAHQADAELVFQELAHRAHAAIAQVVNVVHRAYVLAQLQQILDRRNEVRGIERALFQRSFQAQLDVKFQPAHFAEIILARVEKHSVEECRGSLQSRRIARPQLAVDFDQRFLRRTDRVLFQRARHDDAGVVAVREAHIHFGDAGFGDRSPHLCSQRLVGFQQHFASLAIHQFAYGDGGFQVSHADFGLSDARLHQFLVEWLGDALVRSDKSLA